MSAAYSADDPRSNFRMCSGHPDDFCFFCQFGPQQSGSSDLDMASDLRSIVREMSSNHCEISQIAKRVHTVYEQDVRSTIVWENENSEIVANPEWSIASITRHILHSAEFSLFSTMLDSCFQSILMNLQSQIFEDGTNECDPERLDQFLKTAKTYTAYQTATKRNTEGPGRKRQKTH